VDTIEISRKLIWKTKKTFSVFTIIFIPLASGSIFHPREESSHFKELGFLFFHRNVEKGKQEKFWNKS